MAITPRTTAVFELSNSTTLGVNTNTGSVGDYVVLSVATDGTAISQPAGWTIIVPEIDQVVNCEVFGRFLTGGADDNPTLSSTGATRFSALVQPFGGVDTTTPMDATAVTTNGSSTSSLSPPAITTVTAGAYAVSGVAIDASGEVNRFTVSGTGWSESAQTTGVSRRQAAAIKSMPSAGSSGQATFTQSGGALWTVGWTIALRPASGGGGGGSPTNVDQTWVHGGILSSTTAAVAPTYPTVTVPSGGKVCYYLVVNSKTAAVATPVGHATPAGWTLVGSYNSTNTVTPAVNVGPTKFSIFKRESTTALTGTQSVTLTNNNVTLASIMAVTAAPVAGGTLTFEDAWFGGATLAADTTAPFDVGGSYTVSAGQIADKDHVFEFFGHPGNNRGAHTLGTVAVTGATFGTGVGTANGPTSAQSGTTAGLDMATGGFRIPVTGGPNSGTSLAIPATTATGSAATGSSTRIAWRVRAVSTPAAAAPVADAGADATINNAATFTRTGSGTNTPTSYAWTIVSGPSGVTPGANIGNAAALSYTPTIAGTYVLRLTATNATGSGTDDLTLTVNALANVSTLTDDFASTIDTGKWSQYTPGSQSISGGRFTVVPVVTYSDIASIASFNLLGTSVFVEVPTVPNVSDGTTQAYFTVRNALDSSYKIEFTWINNNLIVQRASGGASTQVLSAAYNATNHRWWRIREASGTIYFDTSANGSTWTNFTSVLSSAVTGFTPGAVKVAIGAGFYGAGPTPGTAQFDNVNLTVAAPVANAGVDASGYTNNAFTRTGSGTNTPTSYEWKIQSGPAGVGTTIGTAAALNWTPTVAGTYVLRFTATNVGGSGFDDMTYTVSAQAAPTVGAGADANATAGTTFSRTATESANGSTITSRSWTIVSGPFDTGASLGTAAALSWAPNTPGTYTVRYSATNGIGTSTDDMVLTVGAASTTGDLPVLVTSYLTSAGTTATTTSPLFTPAVGEVILVKCFTDEANDLAVTGISGGGLTYELLDSDAASNYSEGLLYGAVVGAGQSAEMSVAVTWSGAGGRHGTIVERYTGAQTTFSAARSSPKRGPTSNAAPSATITTTGNNALVSWFCQDWNVVAGTATYRSGATETQQYLHANVNVYAAYQAAVTAGSQTIGMTAPLQKWTMLGVELLPLPGGVAAPTASAGADVANHTVNTQFTRAGGETGSGITERQWKITAGPAGVGTVLTTLNTLNWTPTVTGTYTLEYSNGNTGGVATDTMSITVTTPAVAPVANAGVDASVVRNHTFRRTGSGTNTPTSYAWTVQSGPALVGSNIGNAADLSFTPTVSGTYVLRLTASNAGGSGTDDMTLTVSAGVSDPTSVTGLLYRIRPTNTKLANGALVASLPMMTGGLTLERANSDQQPTLLESGLNNEPALRFDGVDDMLRTSVDQTTRSQPISVVIVYRPDDHAALANVIHAGSIEVLSEDNESPISWSGSNLGAYTSPVSTVNGGVLTHVFNGASSTIHLNNALIATGDPGGGTIEAMPLTVGNHPGVGGRAFDGDIYEVLFYDHALSDSERAAIHQYTNDVYGIAIAVQAPVASAGIDANITLGQTFSRTGSGTNTPTGYAWTIVSGPAGVTPGTNIGNVAALSYQPTIVGTYVIRLTATNGGGSGTDDLTLTVSYDTPTASAGTDAGINLGSAFSRTATEDAKTAPVVSRAWTVFSGPNEVGNTISNAAALSWTPTVAGTYVLRYTFVTDGGTASDDVQVIVTHQPPTANAGVDASTLVNQAFTRTATDSGYAITARAWTIQGGPTGVGSTIGTAAALSFTPTQPGSYTLRYTVTNAAGSVWDEMILTVNGPPVVEIGANISVDNRVNVSRNATETGGGGVTAREWKITAGPQINTVIGNTSLLDWTPTTPGTYTIQYSATNPYGTGTDTLTVTVAAIVIAMASTSGSVSSIVNPNLARRARITVAGTSIGVSSLASAALKLVRKVAGTKAAVSSFTAGKPRNVTTHPRTVSAVSSVVTAALATRRTFQESVVEQSAGSATAKLKLVTKGTGTATQTTATVSGTIASARKLAGYSGAVDSLAPAALRLVSNHVRTLTAQSTATLGLRLAAALSRTISAESIVRNANLGVQQPGAAQATAVSSIEGSIVSVPRLARTVTAVSSTSRKLTRAEPLTATSTAQASISRKLNGILREHETIVQAGLDYTVQLGVAVLLIYEGMIARGVIYMEESAGILRQLSGLARAVSQLPPVRLNRATKNSRTISANTISNSSLRVIKLIAGSSTAYSFNGGINLVRLRTLSPNQLSASSSVRAAKINRIGSIFSRTILNSSTSRKLNSLTRFRLVTLLARSRFQERSGFAALTTAKAVTTSPQHNSRYVRKVQGYVTAQPTVTGDLVVALPRVGYAEVHATATGNLVRVDPLEKTLTVDARATGPGKGVGKLSTIIRIFENEELDAYINQENYTGLNIVAVAPPEPEPVTVFRRTFTRPR
jgi:PKD repeat protein